MYYKGELSQLLFTLPGLLALIGSVIFAEKIHSYDPVVFWIALAASFAGMIFGFIKAPQVKYYRYNHESGFPAFNVSESGNRRESFESFSDLIDERSDKSKEA